MMLHLNNNDVILQLRRWDTRAHVSNPQLLPTSAILFHPPLHLYHNTAYLVPSDDDDDWWLMIQYNSSVGLVWASGWWFKLQLIKYFPFFISLFFLFWMFWLVSLFYRVCQATLYHNYDTKLSSHFYTPKQLQKMTECLDTILQLTTVLTFFHQRQSIIASQCVNYEIDMDGRRLL